MKFMPMLDMHISHFEYSFGMQLWLSNFGAKFGLRACVSERLLRASSQEGILQDHKLLVKPLFKFQSGRSERALKTPHTPDSEVLQQWTHTTSEKKLFYCLFLPLFVFLYSLTEQSSNFLRIRCWSKFDPMFSHSFFLHTKKSSKKWHLRSVQATTALILQLL